MDEDWYNILDILLLIIIICKVIWTANIREWSSNSLLGPSKSEDPFLVELGDSGGGSVTSAWKSLKMSLQSKVYLSYSKALHFHCFLYCWCWMTFFISVKALSPQTSTSSTFSSKFDFFTFKNTNWIYLQSNKSLTYLQPNTAWFIYNQNQAWFIYTQAKLYLFTIKHILFLLRKEDWQRVLAHPEVLKQRFFTFVFWNGRVWFETDILDIGVRSRFDLCRACSRAPYSHTGKIDSFVLEDLHTNSFLGVSKSYQPESTVKYLVNYKCQH